MMGGQVGIADHVTIGAGAMLGAQSGDMSDVPARRALDRLAGTAGARLHEGRGDAAPLARTAGKSEGDECMSDESLGTADIHDILRLLPHRYPFLMVDRVIDMRGDDHAHRHQERDDQRAAVPGPLSRTIRSCPAC